MAKASARAKRLQAPDEHITKDYDPESYVHADSNDDASDASEIDAAETEHYVTVGKSKLREKEAAALGPQYRGSRVSRDALEGSDDEDEIDEDEDEDEDEGHYADPDLVDIEADEAAADDSEIDSDDALAQSDDERLKSFTFRGSAKPRSLKGKRALAADFLSSEDEDEEADALGEMEDDEDEDSEGSDEDMADGLDDLLNGGASDDESLDEDEEDEDEDEEEEDEEVDDDAAEAQEDDDAQNPEVLKGIAIQHQRKTYDTLLNLRIRLQKALIAANTFSTLPTPPASPKSDDVTTEPYAAAEEAAINLLNTITNLRTTFDRASPSSVLKKAGSKRSRGEFESSDPNDEIWADLRASEPQRAKVRNELLEKWSRKTQSTTASRADEKMSAKEGKKSLTRALSDQLAGPTSRLALRTKTPRSCAPVQNAQKTTSSSAIYDDADFYQLLLKDLVAQRTVEADSASAATNNSSVLLAASAAASAGKEAKSRKDVDRKASKGRKMRFTVHEKLQNFMAPEDRRSWETGAIDRFFGTLFGQRAALMDDAEAEGSDEDLDVSGLRLFG